MRYIPHCLAAAALALLAGCAAVDTQVTVLDPALKYAPTQNVAILFEYPPQPYIKIALIEAQGLPGGSESELLEAARKKAQTLGADAIVRMEVATAFQPPTRIYDPYSNPYYPRYRYPYHMFPYAESYPYGEYRWVGGGNIQTLKAVAIRYTASR